MSERKKILSIALPAMAENFLQMLMGLVDSYLVSSLGLVAISGVSLASNIIIIYQALFIALGAAVSSFISKGKGQGDQQQEAHYATESLKLTFLVSLVLALLSIFFGPFMLSFLGAAPDVTQEASLYLSLVGGGVVFLGLMTNLGSLVRVYGKPTLPMYASIISNLFNILISGLGIYVFGWGIAGVALGTVISRAIGAYLLWSSLTISFEKPSWGLDASLYHMALPAAGERLMMRAGDIVVLTLIVPFGTASLAGNSLGEVLTQFIYMPVFGIGTASVILVAQAFGKGAMEEVEGIKNQAYVLSLSFMLPISLFIWLLSPAITGLFTSNQEAIQVSSMVALFSLLCLPMTAGTVIYTALWQGLGQTKLPFYATSIGMWMIRIGAGWLLGWGLDLGLPGVYMGTLLDNGFRWIYLHYRYNRYKKTLEPA